MMTYVSAFIFYTLAMMGILFVGFVIYKKTFLADKSSSQGNIKILESFAIAPKKVLMIIKVKNERFLIATGDTYTTFLAKLENQDDSAPNLSNAALSAILQNLVSQNTIQPNMTIQNAAQNVVQNPAMQNINLNPNQNLNTTVNMTRIPTSNEIVNPAQINDAYMNDTPVSNSQNIYQNNSVSQGFQDVSESSEYAVRGKQRLEQIHRQFKTMYSRDSKTPTLTAKTQNTRKQAIRKLLKDLNEATSNETASGMRGRF